MKANVVLDFLSYEDSLTLYKALDILNEVKNLVDRQGEHTYLVSEGVDYARKLKELATHIVEKADTFLTAEEYQNLPAEEKEEMNW